MPKVRGNRKGGKPSSGPTGDRLGTGPTGGASSHEEGGHGGGGGGGGNVVRTLLAPNTSIGQHFLKNPAVVDAIVSKAGLRPTDICLEVGPGTGNLTVRLLTCCKKLIAVEFDRRMVREVLKRVEGSENERNLSVIQGDVLKVDLPFFDVCVANLPYQISSPFLFKMLSHRPMFRCAVIMFQLEFAQRLTAQPGDDLYCRLSVNTQLLAKVENLLKVGKGNFRPPPKVDSLVVKIEIKNPPPPVNFVEWDGMVRMLFNRKHKTLHAILTVKSALTLLLDNHKTFIALRGGSADTDIINSGGGVGGSSSNNISMSNAVYDLPQMKLVVEEVLTSTGYSEQRAARMDGNDFLCLLAAFNAKHIHFT